MESRNFRSLPLIFLSICTAFLAYKFSCRIYIFLARHLLSAHCFCEAAAAAWKFLAVIESSLAGDGAKKPESLCAIETGRCWYETYPLRIRKSGPHLERENPLSAHNALTCPRPVRRKNWRVRYEGLS
jgi:hypothetical protein